MLRRSLNAAPSSEHSEIAARCAVVPECSNEDELLLKMTYISTASYAQRTTRSRPYIPRRSPCYRTSWSKRRYERRDKPLPV